MPQPNLPFSSSALNTEILQKTEPVSIPAHTEILRPGQYISSIPLVTKGLLKVITKTEEKELLLYYIEPQQSCIMSYLAYSQNSPSQIFAYSEEPSEVMLLPVSELPKWSVDYPELNRWFMSLFTQRYTDLLDTIHHILFNTLDVRVYDYLKEKCRLLQTNPIKISHRQIAEELGTAREVVSRVIKKLEYTEKLENTKTGIKIV
ncbi:Crp/Fnr family transcriptional regulator [Sediminicola luteus]|uniref:HTH crp-type domain-containing protein n=1 Tax=Sediminicola luteus TaxID=319238 RepID=A0A2A4GBA1_9FLAO|nr:Crp/Fnr family transcriptional regulator [Sediminicola luteus]PCE65055.1 hypothetical protein B7P33_05695 [Sediminicola luteus]